MSEYSGCTDFEPLTESYKKDDKRGAKTSKLAEFLKTPEMKKLRKEAMKFQGADKVIKKVKEQGEA
jgi:hypothetical protein